MVLVDTSVWIDFLNNAQRAPGLPKLVLENEVTCHPWVVGEIMMGHLGSQRNRILADLETLPSFPVATLSELSDFVEKERLFGTGLSLIDAQILYTAILENCPLWTHDRRLQVAAKKFRIDYVARVS